MRAEIISVGTELLLGDIVNSNARFLSQQLAALGFTVHYQTTVGDNPMRLRGVIQTAKERSDVLIFTGGLGPTGDDLTKETVAAAFGDSLVLDEDELEKIQRFFASVGREMTENNAKQAMVPRAGRALPNEHGTAPGAFFRQGDTYAFLLPGPPSEMEPMFLGQVRPVLEAMQDSAIRSLVLRVFGLGESDLEDRVHDLLASDNPSAALYAKSGEVHIRITASAPTPEQADMMCMEYAELFRALLGDLVYGTDEEDLAAATVRLLLENAETVATAESCTGGLLSERITGVPGASGVFGFGACTYANEFKHEVLGVRGRTLRRHGAVSSQVAAEMAFGVAKRAGADYGVGITGIAGPDGGTPEKPVGLVYVAAATGRHVYVKKLQMGARSRALVRRMATQHALDMVRRLTAGLPVPGARRFSQTEEADVDRVTRPRRRGDAVVRGVVALLAVLLVLGAAITGLYFLQNSRPRGAEYETPSQQGFAYGTPEYNAAAMELVRRQQKKDPAVTGFLALPDGTEQLVARATVPQERLAQPGTAAEGHDVLLGTDASPAQAGTNTLLLGGGALAPLAGYQTLENAQRLSTMTYVTDRDVWEYRIAAVYLLDGPDYEAFQPAVQHLPDYESFLDFAVAVKARSLYELPVDLAPADRYLTLAVPVEGKEGRTLFLCGRLVRSGEALPAHTPAVVPAGSVWMPAGWYEDTGAPPPDPEEVYARWLRRFLSAGADNAALQLAAGMPAKDSVPTLPPHPLPEALLPASSESGSAAQEPESAPEEEPGEEAGDGENGEEAGEEEDPSSSSASSSTAPPPEPQRPDPHFLTVTLNGEVVTDSAANILAQICQVEAAGLGPEAIKAQAVAAHSWILNQQAGGNVAPAVVGALPSAQVLAAVQEVAHLVLTGDGQAPAFTPWHRMAANGTNTPDGIWGHGRSYLGPVASPQDQNLGEWRQFLTISQLALTTMAERAGISLAGAPETWFSNVEKNESGYVTSLSLGGTTLTGAALWRDVLLDEDGRPLLNSPAFEVSFDGEGFSFVVYGEGHGCGMSQAGAQALAYGGKTYSDILFHYYPGCSLLDWTA